MKNDQEKLNKLDQLIGAIDKAYSNPINLAMRGLLLGVAYGLGATVGVAIVLWVLSIISREFGIPLIGDWLMNINRNLPTPTN